jgi:hypothetical protein
MQNACVLQTPPQLATTTTKPTPFNGQTHLPSARAGFQASLVLYAGLKQRARPIRRTLYANAPFDTTTLQAGDFAEPHTHRLPSRVAEYALDTSPLSASTITVSRSLALSFQSAFQLSFTVLVCYRSRSRI